MPTRRSSDLPARRRQRPKPPASTQISTLSLHDALPISPQEDDNDPNLPFQSFGREQPDHGPMVRVRIVGPAGSRYASARPTMRTRTMGRSEEHTSELQSRENLVCRLLLEKKKSNTPILW